MSRSKILAFACGAALALGACGEGGGRSARLAFPAEQTQGVRVGRVESDDPNAIIGMVLAARLTESGEHVVVLDFAPPYVKVFRRDGTLERAFLTAGDGPGEMRYPSALAVAGDSLVMVAGGARRVAVFGMDGQLRTEGRTRFPVLTAQTGCEGEWIAYGPVAGVGGATAWLHRIRMEPRGIRTAELDFREAIGAEGIGSGLAYGIARNADTVRVWHVLGATTAVLGWRCGQGRPDAWAVQPLDQRGDSPRREGEAVRMTIEPGSRSLSGMAAVPGGVVLAASVVPARGDSATTELTLVTAEGERTVVVSGDYTLRDSHPRHGVLVSTADPAPRLFTISREDLLALFASRD
ncbi:MAG TPA: hypothetical protein VLK84_14650 [Longimicrobium sp.]|nr:hypothetical protein [Longimicrobium sp.]